MHPPSSVSPLLAEDLWPAPEPADILQGIESEIGKHFERGDGMILVTGGTGLLGSFVVRELQGRGKAVRILARAGSAQKAEETGAQVAVGDLGDAESLRQAMQGATGVVHAASTFIQPEVDVPAMEALLDAWELGPFVYISSVDVYGFVQEVPVLESHPLNGDWPYARGKQRCEQLLQEAAKERGRSDLSILRPTHVLGPRSTYGRAEVFTNLRSPQESTRWRDDRAAGYNPGGVPAVRRRLDRRAGTGLGGC